MSKYLFGEIVEQNEGILRGPFGSDLKRSLFVEKSNDTYKVYSQDNILLENNNVGDRYISKQYFDDKMNRYEVKNGDFIITCDGTLGEIFRLQNIKEKGIISSSLLRVRLNEDLIDPDYFYYLFKVLLKHQLIRKGNNSVLKHLPGINTIKNLEIELPDLKTQRKIGNLLHRIDQNIKLNKLIIEKIDSACLETFNYWFLQYEFPNEQNQPYKSSNGEKIYSNEYNVEIPKGWKCGNLYDIATFVNGLACQNYRPKDNEEYLKVVKIREMNNGFSPDTEKVSKNINDKYIINNGDILFSWSASLDVVRWYGGKAGLNQHIFNVIPKVKSYNYVYYQLLNYLNNFKRIALSRKTTMGHITTDHIKQSKIIVPDEKTIKKYEDITSNFSKLIASKNRENCILEEYKNTILKLLIVGQVTINE